MCWRWRAGPRAPTPTSWSSGADVTAPITSFAWSRVRAPARPLRDPKTVLQEWAQGRGLPTPLYREVERRADSEWFALEVNVKPPNEGSMRFHHREGFHEVAQQETRPGKIVSLMIKRLR